MAQEQRYTLEQIAGKIGFRTDDLPALFPEAEIDMTTVDHEDGKMDEAEAVRLIQWAEKIKQIHKVSPDSMGD